MHGLTRLELTDLPQIHDISAVRALSSLSELQMLCPVGDYSSIASCKELKKLILSCEQTADFSFIEELLGLREVILCRFAQAPETAALRLLANLKKLRKLQITVTADQTGVLAGALRECFDLAELRVSLKDSSVGAIDEAYKQLARLTHVRVKVYRERAGY